MYRAFWPVREFYFISEASMKRLTWAGGLLIAAALMTTPSVASAQVDQLIGVNAGGFWPLGENSRSGGDVLLNNFDAFSLDPAGPGDNVGRAITEAFRGGQFGGEYLLGLGDWIEAGVGISYYQRTVNSQYRDFTFPPEGSGAEITQQFKLRIIPVTISGRWFPIGRTTPVQPYVGGGVNIYKWKYSEVGNFIDFSNPNDPNPPIGPGDFSDDGTAVGGVFLAGVRFPFAHNHFLVGGEYRYQGGSADLNPNLSFAGNKLDLGGHSFVGTFHVRF
jgi:hypothetical protein